MAKVAVVMHRYDDVMRRHRLLHKFKRFYMLAPILLELERRGHKVIHVKEPRDAEQSADVAIMHVDLTHVPAHCTERGRSFPLCLNLRMTDISKRTMSDALIRKDTDWRGPVIVKSDVNSRGLPELMMNRRAESAGEPAPFPSIVRGLRYRVFDNAAEVPAETWDAGHLVVEKFVPEKVDDGFGVRFWTFLGETERCDLIVSATSMVKASNVVRHELSPVPERLRQLRERIGLDYGKIDFVMHEGKALALDVNKTMGMPPSRRGSDWPVRYANAFETFLKRS